MEVPVTEEKQQFDRHIGGYVDLPDRVEFMTFAKHRAQEILALTQAIDDPQRTGLTFQQLPRHMRRRVMGHSSKRVPRVAREAHKRQLEKSGHPPPSKRPSRSHRRRPTNLLAEYNRRQKEFVWLETHIWHAKRFHMIDKWGYKIANFPNDKSFRACYRATSKHCLLQDLSYYACIELKGSLERLLDGLKRHTSQDCGLTFGARYFLDGVKEGNATFFRRSEFPQGAIGNVNFLWKSEINKETMGLPEQGAIRTLWIWIHPAFYNEVLEQLATTFKMDLGTNEETNAAELDSQSQQKKEEPSKKKPRSNKKNDKKVEETKLLTRNVPFDKTPKYCKDGVEMVLLKDTLNRFCLTGPLSQAVLSQALQLLNTCPPHKTKPQTPIKPIQKPTTVKKIPLGNIDEIFALMDEPVMKPSSIEQDESRSVDEISQAVHIKQPNDWWTEFYSSDGYRKASLDAQRGLWESLSGVLSPAQLPPHLVVGLTIRDPRLSMPAKRKKAVPDNSKPWQQPIPAVPSLHHPSVSTSAIWCPAVRDVATTTKLSVAELDRERGSSKLLVPGDVGGTDLCGGGRDEADNHSGIPVLLLQRPGSQDPDVKRIGFGCGWDIVMPAGWGMPVWMSLVFRGARVGGLRETAALERERSDVGMLAPDTAAGRREADDRREELASKYFKLPPDKRPNYLKLGITSPFFCAWDVLVREWSRDPAVPPAPFFVLRHSRTLAALRESARGKKTRPLTLAIADMTAGLDNCIVPVALSAVRKGTPVDFSVVCAPTDEDMVAFAKDPAYAGPVEPPHKDVNCVRRRELRSEHKALLKRLRRQRVRQSRKEEETATGDGRASKRKRPSEGAETGVVEEYAETCRGLWLPEVAAVRDHATRQAVGFVACGDFAFTEARGAALGYVALAALIRLLLAKGDCREPLYVLVRNPTSYQYRFAKLDVLA